MSTQAASFHRTVVEDVIKSIREDFINEGVDEQVLEDLKQLWESKLVQAGVYDYPNQVPTHGYAYDLNTYNNYLDASHVNTNSAPSTLLPSLPNPLYSMNSYLGATNTARTGAAHLQALNNLRALNPSASTTLPTPTNYSYDSSGKPQQYLPPPTSTAWNPNSNTLPSINTQYNPPSNIKQHDGANDEMDPEQERKKIDASMLKKYARAQKQKQQKAARASASTTSSSTDPSNTSIPQFDGLGDRKAKDEEEDDDDDEEEESNKGDEELGSDLDDDDDEEEPDTEHIVLCQYEKVTRVKNKRKANLKDGIMHINGKDYVFSRATGEFDW